MQQLPFTKMMHTVIPIGVLLISSLNHSFAAMSVHGRLVKHLLEDYSTTSLPRNATNESVAVSVQLSLLQINEINEKSQYLQIVASLNLVWRDDFLGWNPDDYEGVTLTTIPSSRIWTPDVTLMNSVHDNTNAFDLSTYTRARVKNTGDVKWMMPEMLRSSCEIEVSYYPFDRQICSLKFISWSHNAHEINITTPYTDVLITSYKKNPQWDLVDTKCYFEEEKYACCPEPYSGVICQLVTERRPLFYIYNLVFPSFLLMLIGGLVFRVPPESGEKISLAVTVLLAITVYMMVVMDNVPENSTVVPLLQKFIGTTVILLTLSTMLSVGLVKCQFQSYEDDRPSPWVRKLVLGYIAKLVFIKKDTHADVVEQREALMARANDIELTNNTHGGHLTQNLCKDISSDISDALTSDQQIIRILREQNELLRSMKLQSELTMDTPADRRAKYEWMRIVAIMDRLFCGLYFITVFVACCIFVSAIWSTKKSNKESSFNGGKQ